MVIAGEAAEKRTATAEEQVAKWGRSARTASGRVTVLGLPTSRRSSAAWGGASAPRQCNTVTSSLPTPLRAGDSLTFSCNLPALFPSRILILLPPTPAAWIIQRPARGHEKSLLRIVSTMCIGTVYSPNVWSSFFLPPWKSEPPLSSRKYWFTSPR